MLSPSWLTEISTVRSVFSHTPLGPGNASGDLRQLLSVVTVFLARPLILCLVIYACRDLDSVISC